MQRPKHFVASLCVLLIGAHSLRFLGLTNLVSSEVRYNHETGDVYNEHTVLAEYEGENILPSPNLDSSLVSPVSNDRVGIGHHIAFSPAGRLHGVWGWINRKGENTETNIGAGTLVSPDIRVSGAGADFRALTFVPGASGVRLVGNLGRAQGDHVDLIEAQGDLFVGGAHSNTGVVASGKLHDIAFGHDNEPIPDTQKTSSTVDNINTDDKTIVSTIKNSLSNTLLGRLVRKGTSQFYTGFQFEGLNLISYPKVPPKPAVFAWSTAGSTTFSRFADIANSLAKPDSISTHSVEPNESITTAKAEVGHSPSTGLVARFLSHFIRPKTGDTSVSVQYRPGHVAGQVTHQSNWYKLPRIPLEFSWGTKVGSDFLGKQSSMKLHNRAGLRGKITETDSTPAVYFSTGIAADTETQRSSNNTLMASSSYSGQANIGVPLNGANLQGRISRRSGGAYTAKIAYNPIDSDKPELMG